MKGVKVNFFLSFFFLVEKPDVPAVQPATQSRRERHHQQNTNDQNRDSESSALRTKNQKAAFGC